MILKYPGSGRYLFLVMFPEYKHLRSLRRRFLNSSTVIIFQSFSFLLLQIVGSMSTEQRNVLLFFWTSIKSLPVEGFGGLDSKLHIYRTSVSHDCLPSSRTCFYYLCFPPYPSMDVMRNRLNIITQNYVGCSFGAQ